MTPKRRAAVEDGAPLNKAEEAFGYHICPLDHSRVVGPRFKVWGDDRWQCRCGYHLPTFECRCTYHGRTRSGGCSVCNPKMAAEFLEPPREGELKWEAYSRHEGDVRRVLLKQGCMNSRFEIRQWKKDTWHHLNMAGHTSLNYQKCLCTRHAK
jgi:hypothetical protein